MRTQLRREGDITAAGATASEAGKIVGSAKQKITDGTLLPVCVSASAAVAFSKKKDEEESYEEKADDDEKPVAAAAAAAAANLNANEGK